MPLLEMHLVAEVLILPPRRGERSNWEALGSTRGIFGAHLAQRSAWPVPCSILREAEGRAARPASHLGKAVPLPVANAGFQPVDVRLVPAQDPDAWVSAETALPFPRGSRLSWEGVCLVCSNRRCALAHITRILFLT